jgi:peptidoglycan lytic transglycosylase
MVARILGAHELALALSCALLVACAHQEANEHVAPPTPDTRADERPPGDYDPVRAARLPAPAAPDQVGLATFYGNKFAGKLTSNGERFDPRQMTAAHRKLPFGTWVDVRRPETGRVVRVRINDRGPWGDDRRIIDLSEAAASALGIVGAGVARVELYVVGAATGP